MVISDLSHLEDISEVPSISGGRRNGRSQWNNRRGNLPRNNRRPFGDVNVSIVKVTQIATSVAISGVAVNAPVGSSGDSFAGAASSASNNLVIDQT